MIDRPVFIVGMPRSGSTVLHAVLARHPAFATTTRVTRKAPVCYPLLALLARCTRDHAPGEAGAMWDLHAAGDSDVRRAGDVTPRARAYYTQAVENVLRLYRRPRFLAKCPRLGLRMGWLNEIFPGARFLHLVRDGRAVCRSLLERHRVDGAPDGWWDAKPESWRRWAALPPLEAVAHQWDEVVRAVCATGATLPPEQYREVRYEDFTAQPESFVRGLQDFFEVDWPEADLHRAARDIRSRNDKWAKVFSPEEVGTLMGIMGATMARFGYG